MASLSCTRRDIPRCWHRQFIVCVSVNWTFLLELKVKYILLVLRPVLTTDWTSLLKCYRSLVFGKVLTRISARTLTILTDIFPGFSRSLQSRLLKVLTLQTVLGLERLLQRPLFKPQVYGMNFLMINSFTLKAQISQAYIYIYSVCTSQETHLVSATKPNLLMLFGETVTD